MEKPKRVRYSYITRATAAAMQRHHSAIAVREAKVVRGMLVLHMRNKCKIVFPVCAINEIRYAPKADLREVQISAMRDRLIFPRVGAELSIVTLLKRFFGSAILSEAGKKAGSASSEAKAQAARANGKKGGRPSRKTP